MCVYPFSSKQVLMKQVLPLLFNSTTGIIAWIPVVYSGTAAVMISIPFLQWVVEYLLSKDNKVGIEVDIKELLEEQFESDDLVEVDFTSTTQFRNAVFQTPFRVASRLDAIKRANKWVSKPEEKALKAEINASMFSVVNAESWKGFIKGIVDSGSVGEFELTGTEKAEVSSRFGQTLALEPGRSEYKAFWYEVNQKAKARMPAFGVPMWQEAFSTSIKEYFGIVEAVHVIGSQAQVPWKVVRTFADTKADV